MAFQRCISFPDRYRQFIEEVVPKRMEELELVKFSEYILITLIAENKGKLLDKVDRWE